MSPQESSSVPRTQALLPFPRIDIEFVACLTTAFTAVHRGALFLEIRCGIVASVVDSVRVTECSGRGLRGVVPGGIRPTSLAFWSTRSPQQLHGGLVTFRSFFDALEDCLSSVLRAKFPVHLAMSDPGACDVNRVHDHAKSPKFLLGCKPRAGERPCSYAHAFFSA